jgi:hypothetical protein
MRKRDRHSEEVEQETIHDDDPASCAVVTRGPRVVREERDA